jgi:hypothetical protein
VANLRCLSTSANTSAMNKVVVTVETNGDMSCSLTAV